MYSPLINILIRVSRPQLFEKCIRSIREQTYKNYKIWLHSDNVISYLRCLQEEIKKDEYGMYLLNTEALIYTGHKNNLTGHYWNLYCNELKSKVEDDYLFFMDDDDWLASKTVLQELVEHLQDEPDGLIVQFLRNGKPKPNNHLISSHIIRKGLIGGGCLVLRSDHKDLADWDGEAAADFRWIQKVSEKVQLKFVPLVVQVAGNNGLHGKQIAQDDRVNYSE